MSAGSLFACGRCNKCFPQPLSPVLFCPACVSFFRDMFASAAKLQHGGSGKVSFFADGVFSPVKDCPRSFLDRGVAHCGLCGAVCGESEYGFCCFGLGSFLPCGCGAVLDFTEDKGD